MDKASEIFTILILLILGLVISYIFIGGQRIWVEAPKENCAMPAGMWCPKFYLSSQTDTMNITLKTGLEKTIIVTNISCTKNPKQFEPAKETTMLLGSAASFMTTCNDEEGNPLKFEQGDAYSGKINIQYYFQDEGPGAIRTLSGNVYAKAG